MIFNDYAIGNIFYSKRFQVSAKKLCDELRSSGLRFFRQFLLRSTKARTQLCSSLSPVLLQGGLVQKTCQVQRSSVLESFVS